jgi:23S rRNA (adenine2503-C2)-methyltransferase
MKNIKDLNLEELKGIFVGWHQETFRAAQVFSWIYEKSAIDFEEMSNLPRDLRNKLKENFYLSVLKIFKKLKSKDGTEKFLFTTKGGGFIEAVTIPTAKRVTACISSQVGCKFACSFCASGLSGFKRNLSCAEILDEVSYLKNNSLNKALTHIVFMGTGESLDNYENVIKAIRIINAKAGFNIAARRITISTCGIIPGIKKLQEEGLQIELSVSLHSADDKIRDKLMPVNKKYPLTELIPSCREYIQKTGRQITFEYVLIKDLNSKLPDAQKLAKILQGLKLSKVNLISCNPVKELEIAPPSKEKSLLFRDCLLKAGIPATIRKPRGEDIEAACGQLRLSYVKR